MVSNPNKVCDARQVTFFEDLVLVSVMEGTVLGDLEEQLLGFRFFLCVINLRMVSLFICNSP